MEKPPGLGGFCYWVYYGNSGDRDLADCYALELGDAEVLVYAADVV
jgi:hypothetical protein